jgi:hypothetical protein
MWEGNCLVVVSLDMILPLLIQLSFNISSSGPAMPFKSDVYTNVKPSNCDHPWMYYILLEYSCTLPLFTVESYFHSFWDVNNVKYMILNYFWHQLMWKVILRSHDCRKIYISKSELTNRIFIRRLFLTVQLSLGIAYWAHFSVRVVTFQSPRDLARDLCVMKEVSRDILPECSCGVSSVN